MQGVFIMAAFVDLDASSFFGFKKVQISMKSCLWKLSFIHKMTPLIKKLIGYVSLHKPYRHIYKRGYVCIFSFMCRFVYLDDGADRIQYSGN